jgi:hypothetical protein
MERMVDKPSTPPNNEQTEPFRPIYLGPYTEQVLYDTSLGLVNIPVGRDSDKTKLFLGFEVTSDLQSAHAWRLTAL